MAPATTPREVLVRRGDTAGRIARAHRPAHVTLDQMLVALLRANPNAFIGGNVNRVRAGAILHIPDAEAASAVPADEARRIVVAQTRDFNEFRRRLAAAAAPAAVASADRQASGRVQTEVTETQPAAAAQDRLTLTKPEDAAIEEQIAQARQAEATAAREAELARNIEELSHVASAAGSTTEATGDGPPAPADADAAGGVTVAADVPVPPPAPVTPPVKPASDNLLDHPLALPAGGLLLALLIALGLYRARQRQQVEPGGTGGESRLTDSFFAASGSQHIDTKQAPATSMAYSPSQLEAAGEVDPVAEADVYLAYGRDQQAEEILKEARRTTPARVAIHGKLLEIYAKRRDTRAFEVTATEVHGLTQGVGPEWEHACRLGRALDPENPLYQPNGKPALATVAAAAVAASAGAAEAEASAGDAQGDDGPAKAAAASAAAPATTADLQLDVGVALDLDLDEAAPSAAAISDLSDLRETEALTQGPPAASADEVSSAFDFHLDLPFVPDAPPPAPTPGATAETEPEDEAVGAPAAPALSLDLHAIDLELPPLPAQAPDPAKAELGGHDDAAGDPLAAKLSLAEEFRAIGDIEGARTLAQEVQAGATGALQAKASSFLATLP
jgi:pilus assembly protein FimV